MQTPSTDVTGLKEGDQVTVVFTVRGQHFVSGSWVPNLPVSELGNRRAEVVSVVKAPRVPKVGDRYMRPDMASSTVYTVVFIDDKSVLTETNIGSGTRYYSPRPGFDLNLAKRTWL